MKPFITLHFIVETCRYGLRIFEKGKFFLFFFILSMASVNSFCQKPHGSQSPTSFLQNMIALGPAWNFVGDTSEFSQTAAQFRRIVSKRSSLDIDSLQHYGHLSLLQARKVHYSKGVMDICLGMSSAFVDKYTIDSAKYYSIVANRIAGSLRDTAGLIRSHLALGWAMIYDHSDYNGSALNFMIAYEIAKKYGSSHLIKEALIRLVKINYLKQDLVNAYRFNKELADLCRETGDERGIINTYYMLASLYAEMDLSDRQYELAMKCLDLVKPGSDTQTRYTAQNTAAYAYYKKGNYDSAIYYSRLNLPLARSINKYPSCYTYIAKAYLEKNQLDSARHYLEKILHHAEANRGYVDIFLYLDLGKVAFRDKNFTQSLNYLRLAEKNIEKPTVAIQSEIYKSLYDYYDAQGDVRMASHYLNLYSIKVDSIRNVQNSFKVNIAAIEYETEKLYARLQLLTKDKELQEALFDKRRQQESMIIASIVIGVFILFLGFMRYRRQKDHVAKQELMNERLRISRELHDEVGSTLSGIAMYTHLASSQVKNEQDKEAQHSLNIMQTSASEMVTKLSDIVWLINPEEDTISELFDRLEEYARYMATAKNMRVQIDLPAGLSNYHVPMEARRNIYLFCKESINNAVKYSNGTVIRLQVTSSIDRIRFSVSDDGIGFDEITVRRGNGLTNMRKRAEEIGATIHIESTPNQGAHIALQYKLTH